MHNYFTLLLFRLGISIVFADDMLITCQMEEYMRGRIIVMTEPYRFQTDVADALGIQKSRLCFPDCANLHLNAK